MEFVCFPSFSIYNNIIRICEYDVSVCCVRCVGCAGDVEKVTVCPPSSRMWKYDNQPAIRRRTFKYVIFRFMIGARRQCDARFPPYLDKYYNNIIITTSNGGGMVTNEYLVSSSTIMRQITRRERWPDHATSEWHTFPVTMKIGPWDSLRNHIQCVVVLDNENRSQQCDTIICFLHCFNIVILLSGLGCSVLWNAVCWLCKI